MLLKIIFFSNLIRKMKIKKKTILEAINNKKIHPLTVQLLQKIKKNSKKLKKQI